MWYSTQVWRDHLLFHTIQSQGLAKRTQHFNPVLQNCRTQPRGTHVFPTCNNKLYDFGCYSKLARSAEKYLACSDMADNNALIEQSKTLKKWTKRETTSLIDVSRGIPAFVIYSKSWTSLTQGRKETIFS